MKNKTLLISSAVSAALVCAPLVSFAAEKKASSPAPSASPAASAAKPNARPVPFHGMVSAVDHKANTFTIAGKEKSRVFKVSDKTAITKAGQPAKMADIVENVEVSGSYWKAADDSLEAKTVKIGPAGEKKTTEAKTKASASPAASPAASPTKP
jgi:hypothetical protein